MLMYSTYYVYIIYCTSNLIYHLSLRYVLNIFGYVSIKQPFSFGTTFPQLYNVCIPKHKQNLVRERPRERERQPERDREDGFYSSSFICQVLSLKLG